MNIQKGDRIELIKMDDDPNPIPAGMRGDVESINPIMDGQTQVWVNWDNGRRFPVILPEDQIWKLPVQKKEP